MTRPATGTITWTDDTDEDQGNYEITYRVTPGEPMVRYYADGSGYPGSPDECEILSVRLCERLYPEWKEVMERHFMDMVDLDERLRERVEAACFEDANEAYEAARERSYERE